MTMNITTFEEDLLGLNDFAQRLERFIATEHNFVEGSLVVALSSKYGAGKTTFLQMWKSSLEVPEEVKVKPIVISLNAWESDYYGDPLFAIASAMIERIDKSDKNSAGTLKEALKDIGWFGVAIGSQMVEKATGIKPAEAGKSAQDKKKERNETVPLHHDTFAIYQKRRDAMKNLKKEIEKFVSDSGQKVLFLVDELDRCRPDYAIDYLETIKHIFDVNDVAFVLAADRQQLENSAKMAFGQDLDFEEYFRKFVHREVTLPTISESGYQKLADRYVDEYLKRKDFRDCYMKLETAQLRDITALVSGLKLTPRQIQEVFRILGHLLHTSDDKQGTLPWCIAAGSIIMAMLKIGEPEMFHSLGEQRLDPKEAVAFLQNRLEVSIHVEWWLSLFYTGDGLQTIENESFAEVKQRAGLTNETVYPARGRRDDKLSQWYSGWDHNRSDQFSQIYEKIQQVAQWD